MVSRFPLPSSRAAGPSQTPSVQPAFGNTADAMAMMTQFYGQRRFADALAIGLKAAKRDKKNATLHNMIGVLQFETGAGDAAIASFSRAVRLVPSFADAHYNHGNALRAAGDDDAAIKAFQRALRHDPQMIKAHQNLGNLLSAIGLSDRAIPHYRAVLDRQPDNSDVLNNYALALEMRGDAASARETYEHLLSLKPDFAMAHRNLSLVKTYAAGDNQILHMQSLLASDDLPDDDACNLHFALARAFTQLGDVAQSFAHLQAGNALRSAALRLVGAETTNRSPLILDGFAAFDPSIHAIKAPHRPSAKTPVPTFIVGMPRSGTSLTEQIIASHSDAFGAGERAEMESLCTPLLSKVGMPEWTIKTGQLQIVARRYREMLTGLDTNASVITDKLPTNYRHLGMAMTALPDARSLWMRRDPMATCWSIYQSYFATNGYVWAYDLDDIAAEYAHHMRLMTHWQAMFPDRIMIVDYDALTVDPEPAVRQILAFLDLEWQESCLEFHKTERDVRTLSASQVRQKLYTGSSQKWRSYEAHLGPLKDALQRHGVTV